MSETLVKELVKQAETELKKPEIKKIGLSKDIYTAIFKEGPIQREYRFYAPAEDFSIPENLDIKDAEERRADHKERIYQDRQRRIYNLCKRYERFLRSHENKKVVFVGIPQPFVIDLEAKMASFESNFNNAA